jgi:hypothetical protein
MITVQLHFQGVQMIKVEHVRAMLSQSRTYAADASNHHHRSAVFISGKVKEASS